MDARVKPGHDDSGKERALKISLPADLRAFYLFSDGFNGALDARGHYARLHPLSEVLSATTGYDVASELHLTLIGDKSGDYAFALDHAVAPPRYVGLPLAAAERSELTELDRNFPEFLASLAAGRS
jgi:cell wall assembly regulator SMI1